MSNNIEILDMGHQLYNYKNEYKDLSDCVGGTHLRPIKAFEADKNNKSN